MRAGSDARPKTAAPAPALTGSRTESPTDTAPSRSVAPSARAPTMLVLGGAGFIGRHAVAALRQRGVRVAIGTRHPRRRASEQRCGTCSDTATDNGLAPPAIDYREAHFERLLAADDWASLLDGVDVVVNCVGILRERGRETYDRVHHRALVALAAACSARALRLIHVSALGLEGPARSGFLRSKRDGEAALRASDANWRIVRPSLLDGDGGYGARWLRRVAAWPIHPLPRGARGRIAVLHVVDLGEALATLALREDAGAQREFDLGGDTDRTLAEHLAALRALRTSWPALHVQLPDLPARLVAHVCDLLHLTPFSFGHWELLQRDNRPQQNALPALLGRAPRAIGADAREDRTPSLRPMWVESALEAGLEPRKR
jgi:uncharacterized protein YbjT (DUF2867 family)